MVVMISRNKNRVIVSLNKSTIELLDKICKYYGEGNYRPEASRSEVIDDAIVYVGTNLGLK